MMGISREAVQRARRFVEANARPLDRAYLDCLLPTGAGSVDRVIAELARFQTPEGGFGRALEPDVRGPAASAIATSIGFQYLRGIDAVAGTALAQGAIAYLLATLDRQTWVWPAVDERVGEGPHAPWWAPNLARVRGYVLNPTAELLGYLYDHQADVPGEILEPVTQGVLDAVEAAGVIASPYELACCMRLVRAKALPA